MNKLALFDCDGTLVDSQVNICRAMEECFVAARLDPPERAATRRIVGLSLVEAMRVLVPTGEDDLHHALAAGYKTSFQKMRGAGTVEEPLFDGIVEALAALEDAGWVLGVATGKSDRGLALCLATHGLGGRFVTLQTADRHPSKPHPSMAEAAIAQAGASPATTVVIGDTSYDMAMARAARAGALGVSWGYHAPAELTRAGAQRLADSPDDITDLLETML
jgi:phosphoglycolate phosphatase